MDHKITTDLQEFLEYPLPKINYSELEVEDSLNIRPHTILFDHGIRDYHVQVKQDEVFDKIFFKNSVGAVPFDLLAASFWLLSRYEEYLPHKSDADNRFNYRSSLAWQNNFLHYPLVNVWLNALKGVLLDFFPLLEFKKRVYNYLSTIDIDNVYKYKHKGLVRTLAGLLADKGWAERRRRVRIIFDREEDPFDCYDFLIETHKQTNSKALYFFLLGDYGPNDKNHASTDLHFQSLIKHLADYSLVGIHPSYGSNDHLKQLRKEIARLGNITHKLITKSRQHFAMLKFPHTYKDLLQAGITADYSLGYSNFNGFRSSYCYPYKWYSLEIESSSSLTLHPYCLSEITLLSEAKKKSRDKIDLANELMNEVKKHGGEMISIFHNNSFDAGMRSFYAQFLTLANQAEPLRINHEL